MWVDWQAEPQPFGSVLPGQAVTQTTHAEHAWLVRSARQTSKSICIYMARRTDQTQHAITVTSTEPPQVEECDVPLDKGAVARLLRFVRRLCSTDGAILLVLCVALYASRWNY